MNGEPIITIDCDWAPDFMIEYVANILSEHEIKTTWFITHDSPILNTLKRNSLFELGIHPNFEVNSTQGKDPDSILKNLKKIVPTAVSARTHGLLQSTNILRKFFEYGIKNDVSLLLPYLSDLKPFYVKFLQLKRFPYFWEDDVVMYDKSGWEFNIVNKIKGLKIYDFHPIHIYLNSQEFLPYQSLKNEMGIFDIDKENIKKYINLKGLGTKTFFKALISFLKGRNTMTINDLGVQS